MATLADIKKDTLYWQRLLKFSGYYGGKLDGIAGKLTREAEQAWDREHENLAQRWGRFCDRTEGHLQTVLPWLAIGIRKFLVNLNCAAPKGDEWVLTCGTRSWSEQSALYSQGRTAAGSKVTNANAGQSLHNFGLAVDFVLLRNGAAIWDDKEYQALGKAAKSQGLVWGGTFKSFPDTPHVQLSDASYKRFYIPFLQGTQAARDLI